MELEFIIDNNSIIRTILERINNNGIKVSTSRFIGSKKYIFSFEDNLNTGEIDLIKQIVKEERVKDRLKNLDLYDIDNLRNYNLSQILNYIDNNMNDINTAKMIIKKIVRILWYLLKRDMEDL